MLKVGQKLWYVPNRRSGDAYEVIVTKIGRKWATVCCEGSTWRQHKINKDELWVNGGAYLSPDRCWLSRAAYEASARREQMWSAFRRAINGLYMCPENIGVDTIEDAAKLLGIELP